MAFQFLTYWHSGYLLLAILVFILLVKPLLLIIQVDFSPADVGHLDHIAPHVEDIAVGNQQ